MALCGQCGNWVGILNRMFAFSPNLCVEILNPKITVLEGGVSGRWLGHKGGALMNEIRALFKGVQRDTLTLPPVST